MLTFDPDSARLIVDVKGSSPGVSLHASGRHCVLHLTRNATEITQPHPGVTASSASAINVEGRVNAVYDDLDRDSFGDMQGWRFRVRQLTRLHDATVTYAGATSADGAMIIDISSPPLAPMDFAVGWCSDAIRSAMPYMNDRAEILSAKPGGGLVIINDHDDHPNSSLGLAFVRKNAVTNQFNLLFEAVRDQEFVTAFLAIDKRNVAQILAHVAWRATWNVRCRWRAAPSGSSAPPTCAPTLVSGALKVEKPQLGEPDDAELVTLLKDLSKDYDKTANGWMRDALQRAEKTGAGVDSLASWPKNVPKDFLTT